jgi:hypothetical protein
MFTAGIRRRELLKHSYNLSSVSVSVHSILVDNGASNFYFVFFVHYFVTGCLLVPGKQRYLLSFIS